MAIRTKAGSAAAGFSACCGPMQAPGATSNALWPIQVTAEGGGILSSTIGVFRNKYSILCRNSVTTRVDVFMDGMADNAYSWFTFDIYTNEGDLNEEWMVCADGHFLAAEYAYIGFTFHKENVSGGKLKAKLVKFNFAALGTPENYVDIADSGAWEFNELTVHRVNIRQRYNSVANTMDIEVWINGVQEIVASGIIVPTGKIWDHAKMAWWSVQQFERTAGKGGVNRDYHWSNKVWNDEAAGVGPSGRPGANYVVIMHQLEADTNDPTRDLWPKGGTANLKYQHVDDNNTLRAVDTYIYTGQNLVDEQELAGKNYAQIAGGTASIDAVCIVGEFRQSSTITGRAAWASAALHCTEGAAWTPAIFNSIFATIKRALLQAGEDLRCYNLYLLAAGTDIETPAANPNSDNPDQAPSGSLTSYGGGSTAGIDGAVFGAWFIAPPTPPAAVRRRLGLVT